VRAANRAMAVLLTLSRVVWEKIGYHSRPSSPLPLPLAPAAQTGAAPPTAKQITKQQAVLDLAVVTSVKEIVERLFASTSIRRCVAVLSLTRASMYVRVLPCLGHCVVALRVARRAFRV
jgi:hypothetical protein